MYNAQCTMHTKPLCHYALNISKLDFYVCVMQAISQRSRQHQFLNCVALPLPLHGLLMYIYICEVLHMYIV